MIRNILITLCLTYGMIGANQTQPSLPHSEALSENHKQQLIYMLQNQRAELKACMEKTQNPQSDCNHIAANLAKLLRLYWALYAPKPYSNLK